MPPLLQLVLFITMGLLALAAIVLAVGTWGVVDRQGRRIGQLTTGVRDLQDWRNQRVRLVESRTRPAVPAAAADVQRRAAVLEDWAAYDERPEAGW